MTPRIDILDDLVAHGYAGFTSAMLRERLGASAQTTSNLLAQWRRDGLVDRVARGQYVIRPLGSLGSSAAAQDVALAVAAAFEGIPHRIAFRSALDYHGLLINPARTIQVAATRPRQLTSISGQKLRCVSEPEATITVGAECTSPGAMVSGHLRSLLDVAARPDLGGGAALLAEALVAKPVDPEALMTMARALNAGAALRRLGSVADRLSINGLTGTLTPLVPPRSDIEIDPRDPHRAFRDTRWRVTWAMTPSELEADVNN